MRHAQAPHVLACRPQLCEIFSHFDSGVMDEEGLFLEVEKIGIMPTQFLKKQLRIRFGSITFANFFHSLQVADDETIEKHMANEFDEWEEAVHQSGDADSSVVNNMLPSNLLDPTTRSHPDLLMWKTHHPGKSSHWAKDHDFEEQKAEEYVNNMDVAQENGSIVDSFTDLRDVFKAWVESRISFEFVEKFLEEKGIANSLTPEQEKLLSRCRIDSSVPLSQLVLAFRGPKTNQWTGNFSSQQAKSAQREPFQVVDHPIDVITWRQDFASETADAFEALRPLGKNSQSSQDPFRRSWDIVTLAHSLDDDSDPSCSNHKRQLKPTDKTPFQSKLTFENGHIVPKQGVPSTNRIKSRMRDSPHNTSTKHLLEWSSSRNKRELSETDANTGNKEHTYQSDYSRYRHDDRIRS